MTEGFSPWIYTTPDGLKFWMDVRRRGEIPTLRTEDPGIWIRFLPEQFRHIEAFQMACDGGTWLFTRPAASSMMDTSEYEDLRARNPHLDLAISGIDRSYRWIDRAPGNRDAQERVIEANAGFQDRAQQDRVTGLFCDLMAWSALNTVASVGRGGQGDGLKLEPGLVGFDKPLQARLDAGGYLGL